MAHLLVVAALLSATPVVRAPTGSSSPGRVHDGASARPPAGRTPRARLVAAARSHLGGEFRGDCSGFVRRVYAEAGVALPRAARARSGTEAIVRGLARTRRPRPGDVAYFHRTHDREPPGPGRNLFTHVAVVESVAGPRVTLVHRSNTGVERLAVNLAHPRDRALNGVLRRRRPGDRPGQSYLAGELLGGFASPFRPQPRPRAPAVGPLTVRAR